RAVVQGQGLEDERARGGGPPEQPERVPEQVERQPPAFLPFRGADARRMLRDQVDGTGKRGGQREGHGQDHVPAFAVVCSIIVLRNGTTVAAHALACSAL